MFYKLYQSIVKEILLLSRDVGGVITLFVMPLILIITVTLIQNNEFQKSGNSAISILVVDNDNGDVAKSVIENLTNSGAFSPITNLDGEKLTEEKCKKLVFKGSYQLGIVIPKDLSKDLSAQIDQNVDGIIGSFMEMDSTMTKKEKLAFAKKSVKLYFDPAVQLSFKTAVMSNIDQMIAKIETKSIYLAFETQLGDGASGAFQQKSFIAFDEITPVLNGEEIRPNAVQHNVPAWTLFAIFFIVIPLSINIVKEKSQGTFIRLRTNPVSTVTVFAGKTITYLIICMIQFFMMLGVAVFVFPHLGLPSLNVGGNIILASIVTIFAGFAAIGYGILIGTIARTQEQSAPFGATSVIVLAAMGGVWVPVFAMPLAMQQLAKASPMNWGLEAYYGVFLRHATLIDILPQLALCIGFYILTVGIALFYEKKKRTV